MGSGLSKTLCLVYGRKGRVGYMANTLTFTSLINARRACARVTVVVLCVPVLAASVYVYTCNERYSRVSRRILTRGFSKKPSVQKLWRPK